MKGLDLSNTPVTSKRARDNVQSALDLLEEIQERVRNMGIMPLTKPEKTLQSLGSIDVGKLSNRELESLYSNYVAFDAYLLPQIAAAEASYKIAEANLKRVAANLKTNLYNDKDVPRAEIQARVADSEDYLEHELEKLKLFAVREILDAYQKAYSKQAQALSRSIELRKIEAEEAQRSANTSGYRGKREVQARGGLPGIRRP